MVAGKVVATVRKWAIFLAVRSAAASRGVSFGAMAGGLGVACAGDIVMPPKSQNGLTETSIGVVPAQIGRYIVERVGGLKRAISC